MATIVGSSNPDFLVGTPTDDIILGELANDTVLGEEGIDLLYGDQGNDQVFGGDGDDRLVGGDDNDTLFGETGNDRVRGNLGKDTLYGDAGNDVVRGDKGDDLLDGGTGADTLYGGDGKDGFVLARGSGGRRLANADRIKDFDRRDDVFRLSGKLRYQDLQITQGKGQQAKNAIIRVRRTGEYLAIVERTNASDLTSRYFKSLSRSARDTTRPTATGFTTDNITTGGRTTQTFTVTYSDNLAISAQSIDSRDILVTGPGGFSQLATLVSVNSSGNGTPRTATYQITAPDGLWDLADNGTYQVELVRGQVFDTSGNFVAPLVLGNFNVNVPPANATVSVTPNPASVFEDSGTALVYTFTRTDSVNAPLANSLTVNFAVGGTANSNDYTQTGAAAFSGGSGLITFAPGQTTAEIRVTPQTDSVLEPNETLTIAVNPNAGYIVGQGTATGTILNDDANVSLAVSPESVNEDSGTGIVYTFTRTGFLNNALTVNFSVAGTAGFGTDYTASGGTVAATQGSITFAPGANTATLTLTPSADPLTIEANETIVLKLGTGAGYSITTPGDVSSTILNDDGVVTNLNDSGAGSLRQALLAVNNAQSIGNPTVSFTTTGIITLASALPEITRSANLQGPTSGSLTISGNGSVRVLAIAQNVSVNLSDLTLTNGNAGNNANGGGILNNGGTLKLTNSRVQNSSAKYGGGIANMNGGQLTLDNSSISGNLTIANGDGGGIYNQVGGVVKIQNNSSISNNSAFNAGGVLNQSGGSLTVQDSLINNNSAGGSGGGIVNSGAATLTNTNITGNTSASQGGGILNAGTLTMTTGSVTLNTAGSVGGGGLYNLGGSYDVLPGLFTNNSPNNIVG